MRKWIVGVILILGLAIVLQLGLLAQAMYGLLAAILVSRWLAGQWSENVESERVCNALTAEVGQMVTVRLTVKNRGRWPVAWMLVEDLLPAHALLHDPPRLRVSGRRLEASGLSAGGSKNLHYQLQCNRRGYYQIGPTVLETGDLFGLDRRYRVGTAPQFLLVYPEIVPLEGYELASRRPIGEVRLTYRLYEDPTRIAGVRQYQAGDPFNRVHWRATARTGVLHSKVYEPSTVAGATLLMDFHKASHAARHEPVRSELAVTAAASILNTLYQMGQQIGLVTNGRDAADRVRSEGWASDSRTRDAARRAAAMQAKSDRLRPIVVPTGRSPELFQQLLETLARLELTDGLTLPQLIQETQTHLPRDATVVAILPQVTPDDAIALGMLRRSGFAVTALINIFDDYEYALAAGPLVAEGVEVRQLKDRDAIAAVCRQYLLGR